MVDYRIYSISGADRITAPPTVIECESDEDAIQQARQMIDGRDVEVWQGARCVTRIKCQRQPWVGALVSKARRLR